MGENIPDTQKTLERLRLRFQKEEGVSLSELIEANTVDAEAAAVKMQALNAQIAKLAEEAGSQSPQPQGMNPSDQAEETLTGEQPQESVTGPITGQEMAGAYSGSAALQHVIEDVEADDSLSVTLELGESGTCTVNVNGSGGEAQYTGSTVTFSVTMKEDGATVYCFFEGKASRSGSQIVISGDIHCSFMGITIAPYFWSAQK